MSRTFHLALNVTDLDASIADCSRRLGAPPQAVVPGVYALFRTAEVNLSLRVSAPEEAGTLRHVGFEDPGAEGFTAERGENGIVWERFTEAQQRDEILALWPDAELADR